MSTIKINFDKKSIQNAIKQVNAVKKKLSSEVIEVFLKKCLNWVQNKANDYLLNVPMDYEVIGNIINSWEIKSISSNVMQLVNTSNKAVFVEFGVGSVGENNPHPQANDENYEYNVPSKYKHSNDTWFFEAYHKQYAIDLNQGYFSLYQRENSGKVGVVTKGSPANLYLYNASMDLISTGAYKTLWQESLKETI